MVAIPREIGVKLIFARGARVGDRRDAKEPATRVSRALLLFPGTACVEDVGANVCEPPWLEAGDDQAGELHTLARRSNGAEHAGRVGDQHGGKLQHGLSFGVGPGAVAVRCAALLAQT